MHRSWPVPPRRQVRGSPLHSMGTCTMCRALQSPCLALCKDLTAFSSALTIRCLSVQ